MATETAPDSIREIQGLIRSFGRAFSAPAVDVDDLIALWDQDYPDPIYQPEELEAPLRSWPELRDYFEHIPGHVTGVEDVELLDMRIDAVGDLAYAYVRTSASLGLVRRPEEPLEGEVRQTLIMRRRDGEWRLVHYHESRLTPGLEDLLG